MEVCGMCKGEYQNYEKAKYLSFIKENGLNFIKKNNLCKRCLRDEIDDKIKEFEEKYESKINALNTLRFIVCHESKEINTSLYHDHKEKIEEFKNELRTRCEDINKRVLLLNNLENNKKEFLQVHGERYELITYIHIWCCNIFSNNLERYGHTPDYLSKPLIDVIEQSLSININCLLTTMDCKTKNCLSND